MDGFSLVPRLPGNEATVGSTQLAGRTYLFDQFAEEGQEAWVGHLGRAVSPCCQQGPQPWEQGLLDVHVLAPGLSVEGHNRVDKTHIQWIALPFENLRIL